MSEENEFKDSYYQKVSDEEIISKFRPLLANGGYRIRDADGRIEVISTGIAWETPWHHIVHDAFLDCNTWHSIMFDLFSRILPKDQRFIPSKCQQCWKVVVRPRNLLGLFALMDLQIKLGRNSKCGIEAREYVHGLYGGYFYNHSIDEGLMCYRLVREAVDKTVHLGKETLVILKRACTEFEMACGPSDKWIVTDRQRYVETLVNKWYVRDQTTRVQPSHAIAAVHKRWIEWAYANGDPTYINFTGGKPLHRPVVTYHQLASADEETLIKETAKFKRQVNFEYDL